MDLIIRCGMLNMSYVTSKKEKIVSAIILTLTSGFCFISKLKDEFFKNRNTKIALTFLSTWMIAENGVSSNDLSGGATTSARGVVMAAAIESTVFCF